MATERLTIVVTALNEEGNIRAALADIHSVIPRLPFETDVVMIDDGSTDATRTIMEELATKYPRTRTKVNPKNLGSGRSVLNMYDELPEDRWFSALPGDNEIVAASLLDYVPLCEEHDVILGYLKNTVIRPPIRRLASTAFTRLSNAVYGLPYRYLNGPKLYRVRCFKGLEVISNGHGYNAELLAKAILRDPKIRIGEAPFLARGRAVGHTSAFTLENVTRAAIEFARGYQSTVAYRDEVIEATPSQGVP